MDAEEYESLPTENIGIHMTAGAVAGIMEHCLMYPVDTLKTRMQSLQPSPDANYSSMREGFMKIVSNEGAKGTIRGVTAVIIGAGPAHAMYFSAYECVKARLGSRTNGFQNMCANATAGCGATLLHDAIMVPSEVVKQRMQMFNSPYRSCLDCMCKLYCTEGMRAFYRSYSTQVLMNLPFHASHIVMYEKLSEIFNPTREYNPKIHMFSGAVAGGVAAACTTPLDVCKTLLNTQEYAALSRVKKKRLVGIRSAFSTVYAMHGVRGFFRGVNARILYQMPGTAISWSVYELFKNYLTNRGYLNSVDSVDDTSLSEVLSDNIISLDSQHDSDSACEKRFVLGAPHSVGVDRLRVLPVRASCSSGDDRNLLAK